MANKVNWEKSIYRASRWLVSQQKNDGAFRTINDITAYYKAPWAFTCVGNLSAAYLTLDFIKTNLMKENGDFGNAGTKSQDVYMREYYIYPNGWIVMAAHRLGRFDISLPGFRFILNFFNETNGGCCTKQEYNAGDSNEVDIISTANFGLTCLYLGYLKKAIHAGECLLKFIEIQPKPEKFFYLRINNNGELITDIPNKNVRFYVIDFSLPDQDYFHIGYSAAFLSKLFTATKMEKYLEGAIKYLKVIFPYQEKVCLSLKSGKIGWCASLLYSITREIKYLDISKMVINTLASSQKEGCWTLKHNQPLYCTLDATSEFIIWLNEISANILEKSLTLERSNYRGSI